jgi:hypothetical protein
MQNYGNLLAGVEEMSNDLPGVSSKDSLDHISGWRTLRTLVALPQLPNADSEGEGSMSALSISFHGR